MPCFTARFHLVSILLSAAVATLCGCGLGQDAVEALCHDLASDSRQLSLEATPMPDQAAGCPAFGTLQVETNRVRACSDGCTCGLNDFQTHAEVDTEAVWGTQTTYFCSAKLTRTCLGGEALSCDRGSVEGIYDQKTLKVAGHRLVFICTLPDPRGGKACGYWLMARLD